MLTLLTRLGVALFVTADAIKLRGEVEHLFSACGRHKELDGVKGGGQIHHANACDRAAYDLIVAARDRAARWIETQRRRLDAREIGARVNRTGYLL